MAAVIARTRKTKNMTQKDLAAKLGVTDKAVSKWERGLGYPDIKTLPNLADALGISVNELLTVNCVEPVSEPAAEELVHHTLQYAHHVAADQKSRAAKIAFTLMSSAFLIAIIVCVICDAAVNKTLTWSTYVISSVLLAWFTIAPLLCFGKRKFLISLICLSVLIIPFLAVIERASHTSGWLIPIAVPCAIAGLIYLWIVFGMFTLLKWNKWILFSAAVLLIIIFEFVINGIVDNALLQPGPDVWDYFAAACTAAISAFLFLFWRRTKSK